MKKLVLLLCVLSAVGCVKSYEDYYTRSFVLSYGNMRGISVAMTDFGLGYSVDFVGEGEWDIAMSGKKKDFYNQLCEKHNDVSYNRRVRVYFYDQGLNPRCFRDFVNLRGLGCRTSCGDVAQRSGALFQQHALALYSERLYAKIP